jgi:hypothetical protein
MWISQHAARRCVLRMWRLRIFERLLLINKRRTASHAGRFDQVCGAV